MNTLKILQLGDIHYPDHKDEKIGDIQDSAAFSSLTSALVPNRLQLVMRKVTEVAHEDDVRGILLCGDLTSRGDLAQYSQCVTYVNDALGLANANQWTQDGVHAVPGNHDINREHCDPEGVDLNQKFALLAQSWNGIGMQILPIGGIRSTSLTFNGHSLALISLNSCMGCGERRFLPESIRDELSRLFTRFAAAEPPTNAFGLIQEQLDTPAVVHDDVEAMIAAITAIDETCMPVVLAHHNMLPQALLRLDLYTELLNSGLIRARLASCNRPVVYCHGHIHTDPVEQVIDRRCPNGIVTTISAPLLTEGFNVIAIHFSRNSLPIGCEITEYRTKPHGSIETTETIRVPLVVNPRTLSRFADKDLRSLVNLSNHEPIRFEELWCKFKDTVRNVHRQTVHELVVEADWLSLVQVDDRKEQFKHWVIRRVP